MLNFWKAIFPSSERLHRGENKLDKDTTLKFLVDTNAEFKSQQRYATAHNYIG